MELIGNLSHIIQMIHNHISSRFNNYERDKICLQVLFMKFKTDLLLGWIIWGRNSDPVSISNDRRNLPVFGFCHKYEIAV